MRRFIKKSILGVIFIILFAVGLAASLLYARYDNQPLINHLLTQQANLNFHWRCTQTRNQPLTPNKSVHWHQYRCTGQFPSFYLFHLSGKIKPLTINIIDSDLSDQKLSLVPVLGETQPHNAPFTEQPSAIGKTHPQFIAGINGGYFFTNRLHHPDQNCSGRHYPEETTQNIGDGLLIVKQHRYSENCYKKIFPTKSRPAIVENKQHQWSIREIPAYTTPPNIINALGAGPDLIRTRHHKTSIAMQWGGVLSTFEFSANVSVILAKDAKQHQHVVFLEVNGYDKRYGMNSVEMANFIMNVLPAKLHVNITSAMSMDQGHSSTLYIRDAKPHVVSISALHHGERPVYDALFIRSRQQA